MSKVMADVIYTSMMFPEQTTIYGPNGTMSGDFNIQLQKMHPSGGMWANVSEVKPWEKYRIVAMRPSNPVGLRHGAKEGVYQGMKSKVRMFMDLRKQTQFPPNNELSGVLAWINEDGTLRTQHSNDVSEEKAIDFARWILDVYGVER